MCKFCENAKGQLSVEHDGLLASEERPLGWSSAAPQASSSYIPTATPVLSVTDKLEAERCLLLRSNRVPVTLLTGFLGSGKTTVLNKLLTNAIGKRISVIENEFGEVSIDDQLLPNTDMAVRTAGSEVVLLPNGCLCCRSRADLADALKRVFETAEGKIDALVLEMSGLSEVGPVVQTFFTDFEVQRNFQIDGCVCVCDARSLSRALSGGHGEEAEALPLIQEQLALADRVLLSKVDVVEGGEAGVERVRAFVHSINPAAPLLQCVMGDVPLVELLGLEALSLEKALTLDPHFADEPAPHAHGDGHHHEKGHGHHGEEEDAAASHDPPAPPPHRHLALGFSSHAVRVDDGPLEWAAVEKWLQELMEGRGQGVLSRFKGVLCATKRTPYRRSTIVTKRVVVQGVYSSLDSADSPWEDGVPHCSRMVFIGKLSPDLKAHLNRGLLGCLAPGYFARPMP